MGGEGEGGWVGEGGCSHKLDGFIVQKKWVFIKANYRKLYENKYSMMLKVHMLYVQ
jgi:hypothetical protein